MGKIYAGIVQDVREVRGMGRGLSDHHAVLCSVRLVGAWIKSREVVVGGRRIRSEKLRENRYREKVESCSRIKDGNGRLAQGEDV